MTDLEIVFLASTAIFYLLWSRAVQKVDRLSSNLYDIGKRRARVVIDDEAMTISIEKI
jgi:hypothetical protein